MRQRGGLGPPAASPQPFPWQFAVRAAVATLGAILLVVVEVDGAALYLAWAFIAVALTSEAVATALHWRRTRRG